VNTTVRWWWVRHAPIQGDPKRLHEPWAAADLSDTAAIRHLASILPTQAIWLVSDMRRAAETYGALSLENRAIPLPLVEPDLSEQNLGLWTGKRWDQIPEDLQDDFWMDPVHSAPPEGESFAQLFKRVAARIHDRSAHHESGDIVMIGHSGPIRAALAMTIRDDLTRALEFRVPNFSLTRIDAEVCDTDPRVVVSLRQVREAGAMPALPPQL
jgi:alpha-ribazole phosphatase